MSNHKSNKIALVTGATRGIGLETVRQLGECGIHVLLSGRSSADVSEAAQHLRAMGLNVDPLVLDVSQEDSIAAAAMQVEEKYGRLDILINNAGIRIEEYGRKPSEQSISDWRATIETNLFGTVCVTQHFLPLIQKSLEGRIVNVSSLLASLSTHSNSDSYTYSSAFKSLPAYSASKAAVNSWTVHLAYELRGTPIKVNSVHPGYTRTDLNDGDGDLDVEDGAKTNVRMAMIDSAGPSGCFVHMNDSIPW